MKKANVAAFFSYSFFVLVNTILSYVFYTLIGSRFTFMLWGYTCRIVDGTRFPYEQLLYFIVKLVMVLSAAWLVLIKKRDAVFNLLLLNLAVFNFCGAIIVVFNKLVQRHLIPDVFFSDAIIYGLGGRIIPGAYFLLPLTLGVLGVMSTFFYFRKFQFAILDRIKYAGALVAGVLIPLLTLKLINQIFIG